MCGGWGEEARGNIDDAETSAVVVAKPIINTRRARGGCVWSDTYVGGMMMVVHHALTLPEGAM